MRYTTINTDAGVKNGKAAVAYWIRSDNKWLTGSRALKTPDLYPNEAEQYGIVVALYAASKDAFFSSADKVVVNCDSTDAIRRMETDTTTDKVKPILEEIYKIIPKEKIKFKWVKGHKKDGTSRAWVNSWCDKEVRKHYGT